MSNRVMLIHSFFVCLNLFLLSEGSEPSSVGHKVEVSYDNIFDEELLDNESIRRVETVEERSEQLMEIVLNANVSEEVAQWIYSSIEEIVAYQADSLITKDEKIDSLFSGYEEMANRVLPALDKGKCEELLSRKERLIEQHKMFSDQMYYYLMSKLAAAEVIGLQAGPFSDNHEMLSGVDLLCKERRAFSPHIAEQLFGYTETLDNMDCTLFTLAFIRQVIGVYRDTVAQQFLSCDLFFSKAYDNSCLEASVNPKKFDEIREDIDGLFEKYFLQEDGGRIVKTSRLALRYFLNQADYLRWGASENAALMGWSNLSSEYVFFRNQQDMWKKIGSEGVSSPPNSAKGSGEGGSPEWRSGSGLKNQD